MTAPTKQTSRWGTFLQQAVAGVESRLDNILTEGAEDSSSKPNKPAALTPESNGKQHCLSFKNTD